MITYYVLSTRYAGPLDRYAFDEILDYFTVSTKPARTNGNGEPHTSGWFDVVGDWAKGAHGAYPTLEAAREAIQALAPGARLAAEGEMRFELPREGVVEFWLPRVHILAGQLDDWACLHATTVEIARTIASLAGGDFDTMEQLWKGQSEALPQAVQN